MTDKTDFRESRKSNTDEVEDNVPERDFAPGEMEAFLHRVLCAIVRKYGELTVSQSSILAEPGELSLTPSTTSDGDMEYLIREGQPDELPNE